MTKQDILDRISSTDIFLHYLHLPKFPLGNISSPFSEDKKPSFKLYRNGTFKCFSTGKQGDVWQFVADLQHLDCKRQFTEILEKVSNDLQIISLKPSPKPQPERLSDTAIAKTSEAVFKVETVSLSQFHFDYFNQFGIDPDTLQTYKVAAVKYFQFWQESKKQIIKFPIHDGVIAIAYEVNGHYEIYIPTQSQPSPGRMGQEAKPISKFFYNQLAPDDIFGLDQIPENADHIIIAAGKKDALTLAAHGYYAVSFRSENHNPTPDQIEKLTMRLAGSSRNSEGNQQSEGSLYISYDNDFDKPNNSGQQAQARIIGNYPFICPILLPGNINDIADLYKSGLNIDNAFLEARKRIAAIRLQQQLSVESKRTIFHISEEYINAHYEIRYNTIKLEIQSRRIIPMIGTDTPKINGWKKINENSLFVEMQKKGINVSVDKLVAILKSEFTDEYNPISNYFKSLADRKSVV